MSFQAERPLRSFERSRERALDDSSHFWLGNRRFISIDGGIGRVLAQYNESLSRDLTG